MNGDTGNRRAMRDDATGGKIEGQPHIAIIILNWNGNDDTLECLASLRQIDYPNAKVIVVDNGSTDGSVTSIKQAFPDIPLIETGRNLGFAEGNNVGIRRALEDEAIRFVFLLNNDTTVAPDLLKKFLAAAEAKPDGGIFGAKIYYFSEPTKIWYAGAVRDDSGFSHVGEGLVDVGPDVSEPYETDYVCGCAFFIRREVIDDIGLMDSRFFLTYEETDWCYRARKAGYKSYMAPAAKLWHKISVSFGGLGSPLQVYFMSRNILLWAERNLSRREYWVIFRQQWKAAFPSLSLVQNESAWFGKRMYWSVRSFFSALKDRVDDPVAYCRMIGFRDYLLRRFGDCPSYIRELRKRS